MTTATESKSKTKAVDWAEVKRMVASLAEAGSHEELTSLEAKAKAEIDSVHRIMGIAGATPSFVVLTRSEYNRLQARSEPAVNNGAERIGAPGRRGRKPGRKAGAKPSVKDGRMTRGIGRSTIESGLKRLGGKGGTAELKEAYDKLGSSTPLSVAMAAGVKSGWLKKTGKGRDSVYSLVTQKD